ncbi:TetR/AcrR family transcriptional regulator [Flagellimonas myxillae]|uniref:TetR/AcrR family transcriptional regulator n=1 Tax=Flagellimonas myxillae TaxID=2942214 RepID=UPI00201EEF56|nr:TetR/AcrR family transcriptional regulator [Muricauda myxillae]MCL6267300.1 TetR/AcrR family transcriptional regulator [Muricauda myxillae]
MNDHLQTGRHKQKQETRNRILNAANQLIQEGTSITMDNVAEKAQISRATIYRYYSSIDSLSMELVLQLNVPNTDILLERFKDKSFDEAILGIQKAYLQFILDNENTSRKFLGSVLTLTDPKLKRGQNREAVLRKIFAQKEPKLDVKQKEKFISICVLFMGIESVIASKDVCGLNDAQTRAALQWGMEMILKGYHSK